MNDIGVNSRVYTEPHPEWRVNQSGMAYLSAFYRAAVFYKQWQRIEDRLLEMIVVPVPLRIGLDRTKKSAPGKLPRG